MKVTVADVVSPSYFVAIAAVELGFFRAEGLDAEFVRPPENLATLPQSLHDGQLDFLGSTASDTLTRSDTLTLLCALSQYNYWFLGIRADLKARQGDLNAIKGLRISASPRPTIPLKRLLIDAGIDLDRDNVQIVGDPPHDLNASRARVGIPRISARIWSGEAIRRSTASTFAAASLLPSILLPLRAVKRNRTPCRQTEYSWSRRP